VTGGRDTEPARAEVFGNNLARAMAFERTVKDAVESYQGPDDGCGLFNHVVDAIWDTHLRPRGRELDEVDRLVVKYRDRT